MSRDVKLDLGVLGGVREYKYTLLSNKPGYLDKCRTIKY